MKLSIVTRIFAGYLLVLLLLGAMVVYCVVTMGRMGGEVTVAKEGLLPVSARLQKLSHELAQVGALLRKGGCEENIWLSHHLPEMRPYETLQSIGERLDELSNNPRLADTSRELFASVAGKISVLTGGDDLFSGLATRLSQDGIDIEIKSDRQFLAALIERFVFASVSTPPAERGESYETLRGALQQAIGALRKNVAGFEATCRFAINNAWSDTIKMEEDSVRVALYLGLAALVVIAAVAFLFHSWLRPLGKLRAFAQRISLGEYGHPPPVDSGDEIGELSRELAKMAHRLKEREEMIRSQSTELLRADRFSTIGKMSTQIAHEIRNPLNALGLKLELLEDSVEEAQGVLPPKAYSELKKAAVSGGKEIDRLREITDYYLKFAKFPKVEKEPVDLHMVLTDVVSFYEDEAREKGISIDRNIEKHLRTNADANLIRHAVANLLKNAIEAITDCDRKEADGVGRIAVKAWCEGGLIRLTIKDNGPGVPGDQVGRVFEPFYSTKRSGTGLGLTLVQQIVDEHGGAITCASTRGEGTVFKVSLPA